MAQWVAAGAAAVLFSQAVTHLLREEWEVRTSYYKPDEYSFCTSTVFHDSATLAAYMAYTRQTPHTTALVWHKPRGHMWADVCVNSQFQ
jgi:hypothetical protein